MRNLKKVLSLVLALAMVLSICMVGAGAVNYDDFGDKDEITKKEAVATLVNLDVINGYNDGKEFRPQGNVTRAEMVTMICRVLAGGDNMIPDATKPVPTYTDVRSNPSAAWAETYIEYCTSLGIVSGKGNGIFDPMADVTAAEASKMVMTAVGYNADIEQFKGIGWDINTMAKASTLKLLTNLVGEISANAPVTREQVAQLIYNAMTIPMVQNYNGNTANLWIGSGANAYQETLMEKSFNAKKVTGVVVANEWASLYADRPISKGKTTLWLLDNEGDVAYEGDWSKFVSTKDFQDELLTVSASTTLEQIGSSVTVLYKTDTRQNIFGIVMDSGLNHVVEFTKGAKLETPDLEFGTKVGTKYFVNYDDETTRYTASDYKIKYVVVLDSKATAAEIKNLEDNGMKRETATGYTWYREIQPEKALSDFDRDTIQAIFYGADLKESDKADIKDEIVNGEVYVGTQSKNDISDELSWREFRNKYLTDSERTAAWFDKVENGNYAKLVDCDNDGVAEFAFKIEYFLDEVLTARERGGAMEYTFYGEGIVTDDREDNFNADRIETSEELAKGDVVVCTIIDHIAYADVAEIVTGAAQSVSYRNKTMTTTDGDTYEQSEIDNLTGYAEDITNVEEKIKYNFYFDKYGYIRAYAEVDGQNIYGLLTEAYTTNERNGKYVRNEIGIVELKAADARITEYEVENYDGNHKDGVAGNIFFEDLRREGSKDNYLTHADEYLGTGYELPVDRFDWDKTAGGERFSKTNVARYVLDEEEGTVKVYSASVQAKNKSGELLYYWVSDGKTIKGSAKDYEKATGSKLNLSTATPVMAEDYVQLEIKDLAAGTARYEMFRPTGSTDPVDYVNAVHDTQYYLVRDGKVEYFTDYKNLPKINALNKDGTQNITAIYAVAENTTADSSKQDYWVADVIVIELTDVVEDYDSISLAFFNEYKTVGDVKYLNTLNNKTENPEVNVVPTKEGWPKQWEDYGFYKLTNTESRDSGLSAERIERIQKSADGAERANYNSFGIYAGVIEEIKSVRGRGDYITLVGQAKEVPIAGVPVYTMEERGGVYSVKLAELRESDVDKNGNSKLNGDEGSEIIYVMNGSKVAYIVNTGKDNDRNRVQWLVDEYDEIIFDQAIKGTSADATIKAAQDALKAYQEHQTADNLAALEKAYDAAKALSTSGLTTDQAKALGDILARIENEIGGNASDVADALVNAYDAWKKSNDGAKEKAAMFKAAVDYKPHNGQPSGTELGNKAYAEVVKEAAEEVADYVTALTAPIKLENLNTVGKLVVDDNALTLAKTVTSGGVNEWNDGNYNTAVANWNKYKAAFAKAVTLVNAYVDYGKAGIDDSKEVAALIEAYNAIAYNEHLMLAALTDSGYPGGTTAWSFTDPVADNTYYAAWEKADFLFKTEKAVGGFGDNVTIDRTMSEKYSTKIDMSMFETSSRESDDGATYFDERRIHFVVNSKAALDDIGSNPIYYAARWLCVDLTADGTQIGGKDAYEILGENYEGSGKVTIYPEMIGNRYTENPGDFHDKAILLDFYGEDTTIDERLILCFDYEAPAQKTFSGEFTNKNTTTVSVKVTCDNDSTDETGITSVTIYKVNENGGDVGELTKIETGSMKAGTAVSWTVGGAVSAGDWIRAEVEMSDGQTVQIAKTVVVTP